MVRNLCLSERQASALTMVLLTTKGFREGEQRACEKLALEKKEDGTPRYPKMAGNAETVRRWNTAMEEIQAILDNAPLCEGPEGG